MKSFIQRFSKRAFKEELDPSTLLYFFNAQTWGKRIDNGKKKSNHQFVGWNTEYACKRLRIDKTLKGKSYAKHLSQADKFLKITKIVSKRTKRLHNQIEIDAEAARKGWFKCPEKTLSLKDYSVSERVSLIRLWSLRNNDSFQLKEVNLIRVIQLAVKRNGQPISTRQAKRIKSRFIKNGVLIQHPDNLFELANIREYELDESSWASIPSKTKVEQARTITPEPVRTPTPPKQTKTIPKSDFSELSVLLAKIRPKKSEAYLKEVSVHSGDFTDEA